MKLREWRETNKLSLSGASRLFGVANAKVVWRWEKGEQLPKRKKMVEIYIESHGAVRPDDFYDLPALPELQEVAA